MRFPANRALLWPQLLLMDRLLPEALHAIAWLDGRPLPVQRPWTISWCFYQDHRSRSGGRTPLLLACSCEE